MRFRSVSDLRDARPDLATVTVAQVAFPGPLRDRLVAAYLSGEKTAGTSLLREFEIDGETLPEPGDRSIMIDSALQPVAVLTVARVEVLRMGDVDLRTAHAEGEGFVSVDQWRAAHVAFWTSEAFRGEIGGPTFTPTDDENVVVTWVTVTERM